MEDSPEGRDADEAMLPELEPATGADATSTAEAGATSAQMDELPTDDSQEESSKSVAGDRARRELQVILDILPSLKAEIPDPGKLSDEIALKKLAEIFARLDSAAGVPQTIGVGGLASGFMAGGPPRMFTDLDPREKRHVLPDAPDELKRDFRLLAHGANYAETRETSVPDGTVDGFLDTLEAYASSLDMELDTMEKILITAKRYLSARIVDMQATRRSEQAAGLQFFADAFDHLLARFLKPPPDTRPVDANEPPTGKLAPPTAAAEPKSVREWSDLTMTFISDERVTIAFSGTQAEHRNYEEMGFGDGRGGRPRVAWLALREMSRAATTPLRIEKKRAQEIRAVLKGQFSINSDPLLFKKQLGYVTRFKICRSSSFDT